MTTSTGTLSSNRTPVALTLRCDRACAPSAAENNRISPSPAQSFNGDISKWDVSRVTNMVGMFYNSLAFDGDILNWDVSSVTDMSAMFSRARSFDGDITKWDV